MNKKIDFENSLGPWLGKTVKILDYSIQERLDLNKIDLTKEQMIVLKKLHDEDGLNQNDLAFLTLRNKSSLTRLLSKMEKKKYIIRKKANNDKRIKHVFLTELGREVFINVQPVIKSMISQIEKNISEEEKNQIIKILKKVQSNFGANIESI